MPDAEVDEFEEEETDEDFKPKPLIPDNLDGLDLTKPQLGSQESHANMLMEQAAALGQLKLGLLASGFDPDEAWILTRQYAGIWWNSQYERQYPLDDDD